MGLRSLVSNDGNNRLRLVMPHHITSRYIIYAALRQKRKVRADGLGASPLSPSSPTVIRLASFHAI
jgi:hypothetical protein